MPESGFIAAVLRAVSPNYCLAAMLGRYCTEHCLAEGKTWLVDFAEFAGQWVGISRSCGRCWSGLITCDEESPGYLGMSMVVVDFGVEKCLVVVFLLDYAAWPL